MISTEAILFSVASGMALFFVSHIFFWRLSPSDSPRIFLLGLLAGIGLLFSVGIQFFQSGNDPLSIWSVVCFDLFVVIFYAFIYAGVSRSVSLTLLSHLLREGEASFSALSKSYQDSSRLDDRILLMKKIGWLMEENNRLHLAPKGRRYAILFGGLSKLLRTRFKG